VTIATTFEQKLFKVHLSFKLVFDKHIIYFFTNVAAYWDDLLSNKIWFPSSLVILDRLTK